VRQPNVEVLRAREIEISAERPFTLYADGDPVASLPVKVRALAGAVRVIVPR
jgi:diacylglycerol kinase family enzyme